MKTFSIFWRQIFFLARNFLARLAIISLLAEQFIFVTTATAHAAELPVTPDGSTNTSIDRAANNVPIVNIAAPNSSGLSHNRYSDFNVNQQGLILNNSIGSQNGVIQTQIGGLINDNANLKNSGAASVILNEVTSNNISQINGYTEIAGKKADLVLANPNGFVFNGSGFINVSKFTAVVGSVTPHPVAGQFNPNPADLTFRLSDNAYAVTHGFLPKLTIMGAGIDLENITSTDLVANVMNIVAPVYGGTNDVNLRTGDQTFNYASKEVTSDNSNPGHNLPDEVAIDASVLGKIQAGRIFIVATKEGFGIKYSGDLLASRAGITIDNQGNIDYNNIASEVGN
ncbi:MAG: filamentous hemagglutinin N-terminal domain-containing protein, partial [Rickettsiales bacterium]|nr:filamentous hemagglutinin N-terminal domain-containing protein [Rickettsiales bacterium]